MTVKQITIICYAVIYAFLIMTADVIVAVSNDAKGPVYSGADLNDIIGYDYSDFVEMNATNFAGFDYDIDEDIYTERLRIYGGKYVYDRTIYERGLEYETSIDYIGYESTAWEDDNYFVMGFFGNLYVPLKIGTSLKLAKFVTDNGNKYTLRNGQSFELGDGYAIAPKQIDVEGGTVWLALSKDGQFIDDEVIDVSNGEATWVYKIDIATGSNVEVMRLRVTDVFQGQVDSLIVVEGIWLVDFRNILEVDAGGEYGVFEVEHMPIDESSLILRNNVPVILTRGSVQELAEELKFKVADSSEYLEFYLTNEQIEPRVPKTIYVDDDGKADFDSIQDAVDAAIDGDTILVYPGTYIENVYVNKELTIGSISQDPGDTVVTAYDPADNVFRVVANNVSISGFKVTGANGGTKRSAGQFLAGIYLEGVEGCVISDNSLSNNLNGICLYGSSKNELKNNNASSNVCGIFLSDETEIYYLYVSYMTLAANSDNILQGNTLSNNSYGLAIWDSGDNLIYNNYFNNTHNVYLIGPAKGNIWNVEKQKGTNIVGGPCMGGNYWATPNGTGLSQICNYRDGICVTPYIIDESNIDHLPLIAYEPDLAILSADRWNLTDDGEYLVISIEIINQGARSVKGSLVHAEDLEQIWPGIEAEVPGLDSGETITVDITMEIPEEQRGTKSNFTIEIDPWNEITELNESNNIKKTPDILIPLKLPDLFISYVNVSSENDSLVFFVNIVNQGNGSVDEFLVSVGDSEQWFYSELSIAGLGPGENRTLEIPLEIPENQRGTTHNFTVAVDPENDVVEWDESNNIWSQAVRIEEIGDSDSENNHKSPTDDNTEEPAEEPPTEPETPWKEILSIFIVSIGAVMVSPKLIQMRWETKAIDKCPEECPPGTEYCVKEICDIKPGSCKVVKLCLKACKPKGRKNKKIEGDIVSGLNRIRMASYRGENPDVLLNKVEPLAFEVLEMIREWLGEKSVSYDVSISADLDLGEATCKYTRYICEQQDKPKKKKEWEKTIKGCNQKIGTLNNFNPADPGISEELKPDMTRMMMQFIEGI